MCSNTTVDPSNIRTLIQVQTHALPANYGSSVRATFGMGLWIALVLHVIGVELYVRIFIYFKLAVMLWLTSNLELGTDQRNG